MIKIFFEFQKVERRIIRKYKLCIYTILIFEGICRLHYESLKVENLNIYTDNTYKRGNTLL